MNKRGIIYYLYVVIILFSMEHAFECDIWSTAMILFELMEGDYPHSLDFHEQRKEVKEGKIKPLTRNRPLQLVTLYDSMRKIVRILYRYIYIVLLFMHIYICIIIFCFFFVVDVFICLFRNLLLDPGPWSYFLTPLFTTPLLCISFLFPNVSRFY
jgi:hypothetical protein